MVGGEKKKTKYVGALPRLIYLGATMYLCSLPKYYLCGKPLITLIQNQKLLFKKNKNCVTCVRKPWSNSALFLPSYVEKINSYLQFNKLCVAMLFRCYNGGTCGTETLLGSVENSQVSLDWDGVIL